MLTYTVTSSDLAEADIYAIEPVASLREFLKPHQSLCIVKTPCDGCIPEMTRVMGKDRRGDPVKIYLGNASENDQGYLNADWINPCCLPIFIFRGNSGASTPSVCSNAGRLLRSSRISSRRSPHISPVDSSRKNLIGANIPSSSSGA